MANRFGSLIDGSKKQDEDNRFSSLVQAPAPVHFDTSNLLSSHVSTMPQAQPSTLMKLGQGLTQSVTGGIGYKLGAALRNGNFSTPSPMLPGPQTTVPLPSLAPQQSIRDKMKAFDIKGIGQSIGPISNIGKGIWGGITQAADPYKQDGNAMLYAAQQEALAQEKRKSSDSQAPHPNYGSTLLPDAFKAKPIQQKTKDFGQGNIDLNNRPIIRKDATGKPLPNGDISTVYSYTLWPEDTKEGKYIVIPGVRAGLDRQMTPDEARDWYLKSGEFLGKFNSDTSAESYGQSLHDNQATQYVDTPKSKGPLLPNKFPSSNGKDNTPTSSGRSYLDPFANSADLKAQTDKLQARTPYQPIDTAGKAGNMLGSLLGNAPAFAMGGAATEGIAGNILSRLSPKIVPKILPYAERAVKDSLSFAPMGLMESNKLQDIPKNVGTNALTGAVMGPAFLGIGKGISKGIEGFKGLRNPSEVQLPPIESTPVRTPIPEPTATAPQQSSNPLNRFETRTGTVTQGTPIPEPTAKPIEPVATAPQHGNSPTDFPFPTKDIPIIRYQKEAGAATYSDARGGTWFNRVNNIHGENTGYNAADKTVGGMNQLKENYTPKKPLLVNDTTSPGAGQAAIRAIKGEKYLNDIYTAWGEGDAATKVLLKEVGLSDAQSTELLAHPDQPQILFDRIGTELAKKAGYDSIVHTTPNGTYAEVVKLSSDKAVTPQQPNNLGNPNGGLSAAAKMDHLDTSTLRLSDNPKAPEPQTIPAAETTPNKYVDTKPIDISIGKNDKATSADIRQGYVGKMNAQIVTGNQLSDTMKKLAPKEQEGIQLYIDAGGDTAHLQEMANHEDPILNSFIPNTKVTYREAYNQALNLSPEAQKAAEMAQTYYKESGQYALETGSTKSVLENYSNRLWKQDPGGTVKTETRTPGLNPNTSHSKERVFGTLGEGILAGKEPATLNAGDLLSIHNQEMARANTNRVLATSLKEKGLGNYQTAKAPAGFTTIDSMSKEHPVALKDGTATVVHQNFVIPDGIAKGLQSITDPNYMAKVDAFRHLQAYQGLVKTVDLSFSLFHHITLAAEALYNNRGGVDFIKNWGKMTKLGSESFNAAEKWGAEHGLMTTKIDSNYDVLRNLSDQKGFLGKVGNLPGFKQAGWLADKNSQFLFGKIQRWLKVTDFQNKAAEFVGKNPNMQNAEVTKGLRQIASEINDSYGGLNWKAIGVTPSIQAISRLGLLAPDWTFSSVRMLGRASGLGNIEKGAGILANTKNVLKGNVGNSLARTEFAVALIGGGILTEGLNKLISGHYTDQNAKGHELEVEVQPGVYISMFRSGIGDAAKWGANMLNQGVLSGTVSTAQAKMSPFMRTAVGQLSNKQATGAPITSVNNSPIQNDLARLKSVGETFAPMPMGVPNMQRYLGSDGKNMLGGALVGTGAARYSKTADPSTMANPANANSGNWIDNLLNPKDKASSNLIDKISTQEKAQVTNTKLINEKLNKSISSGGSGYEALSGSGLSNSEKANLIKEAKAKQKKSLLSPLAQKFDGLSKSGQQQLLKGLTSSERAALGNVTIKK